MSKSGALGDQLPQRIHPWPARPRGVRLPPETRRATTGRVPPGRVVSCPYPPLSRDPQASTACLIIESPDGRAAAPAGSARQTRSAALHPTTSRARLTCAGRNTECCARPKSGCAAAQPRGPGCPFSYLHLPSRRGMPAAARGIVTERHHIHRIRNGQRGECDQEARVHLPAEEFLPGGAPGVDPGLFTSCTAAFRRAAQSAASAAR